MKNYFLHILEGGWNVAVRNLGTGSILKDRTTPFQIIPNTWRTWAADPFLFEHNGIVYIFAELFDYIERKGGIGYTSFCDGKWTNWRVAICEPFHMSYPNLFKMGNEIYMIPESSGGHSLRLYKAITFPDEWKLEKIIAQNVSWVDTTFFRWDSVLFAVTTDISKEENQIDYLLRFNNQFDLISQTEIKEHHTDYSRSGGNFFMVGGRQIRVSQDCSKHYGGSMIFSEFIPERLCENGIESEFLHLYPDDIVVTQNHVWTGLHTYNSTEHYEVVDIERKHFNPFGIVSRLLSKL